MYIENFYKKICVGRQPNSSLRYEYLSKAVKYVHKIRKTAINVTTIEINITCVQYINGLFSVKKIQKIMVL